MFITFNYLLLLTFIQILYDFDKIPKEDFVIHSGWIKDAHEFREIALPCILQQWLVNKLIVDCQQFWTDIREFFYPVLTISFQRQYNRIVDQLGNKFLLVRFNTILLFKYYSMSLGFRFLNYVMMFSSTSKVYTVSVCTSGS